MSDIPNDTPLATPKATSDATPNAKGAVNRRSPRRTIVGIVTSAKMVKTISVQVSRKVKHPTYGKYVTRYIDYKAHDEKRAAKEGDHVEIAFARRLSKTKAWTLIRIVSAARVVAIRGEEEIASLPVKQLPPAPVSSGSVSSGAASSGSRPAPAGEVKGSDAQVTS